MKYTLGEIAQITGGQLLQGDPKTQAFKSEIDSRKDVLGALFCAIKGEKVDGHDFVNAAVQKGAVGALVQHHVPIAKPDFGLVLVNSTSRALADLASAHREQSKATVIGVTGSVGKTSTKDLIGGVLGSKFKTYKNPGNLNSHIGLPLAMLSMDKDYDYAVFEMAMRGRGEIKELCEVAKPQIGVLTDISASHIGILGSINEIFLAKAEILQNLPIDGLAVLCWDNELVKEASRLARCRVVTYGFDEQSDCRGFDFEIQEKGITCFKVNYFGSEFSFHLKIPGIHQVQNALAAVALGFELGLSPEEIKRGLLQISLSPMRQEVMKTTYLCIINDAYNASVKSMESALDLLSLLGKQRKIAILGDMLEMGEYGQAAHVQIGRYARTKADALVAIGPLSAYTKKGWDERATTRSISSSWFPDKEGSVSYLSELLRPGDTCLVKASRGFHFEWLVEFLANLDLGPEGDGPN